MRSRWLFDFYTVACGDAVLVRYLVETGQGLIEETWAYENNESVK
jgi:hypothetical protein